MQTYSADIKKITRTFLPLHFEIKDWASIQPYFDDLVNRNIDELESLELWLKNSSELEAAISEDACWRQIKMTCDTTDKEVEAAFMYFCNEIQPHVQAVADVLNKKLLASKALHALDTETYKIYLRTVRNSIELFNEKNIPINSELSIAQQQFGTITGAMMVTIDSNEYTLQQAAKFYEHEDRNKREQAYRAIAERRMQDRQQLDELFDSLRAKRQQLAENIGDDNYVTYRFKELGRFDYSPVDCTNFHEGIKLHVMPLVDKINEQKRNALGLDTLRPWDTEAEPAGTKPLTPFTTGKELLEKSVKCFDELNPFFANCLRKMNELGHFDLESRKGKAPGGYNCPLAESGAPFIFMNAAGQMGDVTTMVHEGGHAVHSFLAHELQLSAFKEYPMEIAEVASMAMELFSMEHWQVFFNDEAELRRAKIHQIERCITIFPWIATIDKFQFWIYNNPNHSVAERTEAWMNITKEFSSNVIDSSGLEAYRETSWQRQLHLYEVPFYYIEYGIAQLGAIGMYQQYKQNKEQALANYCNALALGGTKTLPELYAAAGLAFDFSPAKIKNLVDFLYKELEELW